MGVGTSAGRAAGGSKLLTGKFQRGASDPGPLAPTPGGTSSAFEPPRKAGGANRQSAPAAIASHDLANVAFPPGIVKLLLPDPTAERVKRAVLKRGLEWQSPVTLGDTSDGAQIHLIAGRRSHLALMYFDGSQDPAKWPIWYLSSLFVRVCRKSKVASCDGPPSVVLLVSDPLLRYRWASESDAWKVAGLIADCQADLLGEWDDGTADEKVEEWVRQLRDSRSQALTTTRSRNALAALGQPTEGRPARYFVFIGSPGDTAAEREEVRDYFERQRALRRNVVFEVRDWENFTSARYGDPQKNIFEDVLPPELHPLIVLVIFVFKHKIGGDPTRESGTKQEFEWATRLREHADSLVSENQHHAFPEIKLFFSSQSPAFDAMSDEQKLQAGEQYNAVLRFKAWIKRENRFLTAEFANDDFRGAFQKDLDIWLSKPKRPWNENTSSATLEQKDVWPEAPGSADPS